MVVALFLTAALAAIPTEPRAFQWRKHPELAHSEQQVLVKASSKRALRLQCPEESPPPFRRAVIRSSGAPAALASGPWSTAEFKDGYWTFPKPPFLSSIWLINAPKCSVESLASTVSSSGLARLEHLADDEDMLMEWLSESEVLNPKQLAWLQSAEDLSEWRSRYMTMRPTGPHPAGRMVKKGDSELDGSQWISAPNDFQLTLPPHQRHSIKAVFLGPRTAACLYLDQQPHCKSNAYEEEWTIENGSPTLKTKRWDGLSQSKPHRWTVLTGDSAQELSIDGPALIQISSTFPQNYLWRNAVSAEVYPQSEISPQGEALQTEQHWAPTQALNGTELYLMEELEKIQTAASAWFALDSIRTMENATNRLQWLDETNRFSIWIPYDGKEEKCSIQLKGRTHSIKLTESKVHRFVWLSNEGPDELPTLDGCSGLMRILNPPRQLPNPTLRRQYHEMPEEGLYFTANAAQKSWLRFTHPTETNRASLRLEQRSGRAHQIEFEYLPQHSQQIIDDTGQAWRRPISLQLDEGWDGLMVHSLSPTRVRLSQPSPVEPTSDVDDLNLLEMDSRPSNVHSLTLRIQQSQSVDERIRNLEKRAQMLAKLGETQLALLDMRLADKLRGEAVPLFEDLRSQQISEVLYPYSEWRPVMDDWMEDTQDTPMTLSLLTMAAEEQSLQVAERLTQLGQDSRYWWRKAILGGAFITRENAIIAYQQSIRYDSLTPQSHAFFWPLRTLSYNVPIYVRPKGVQIYRGDWPAQADTSPFNPQTALFEEAFPDGERKRLDTDKGLTVPPLSNDISLALHCRPKSSRGRWGRCAVEVTSVDGAEPMTVEGEIWGQTKTFSLPPSKKVRVITVPDGEGLLMELRIPSSESPKQQVAWQLKANRPVEFSILGPTVLQLDTWSFDGMDASLEVTTQSITQTVNHTKALIGSQQHQVLIPTEGLVKVTLQSDRPIRIRPFIRDSEGGQLPPPEVPEGLDSQERLFMTDSRDATNRARTPAARPIENLQAERFRLDSKWSPNQAHSHRFEWTHFERIPTATRWWSAGLQAHQFVDAFPVVRGGPLVLDAHAGFDWLHNHEAFHFWLIGDVDAGFSLSEPLAARERLALTARADRWWSAQLQTIFRFKAQQYAQLAPHPEPYFSIADSAYGQAHPYQLQPEAEMRFIPTPWIRIQWRTGLKTNSPGEDTTVDQFYGTAMLNIGAPQRWLRLYSDFEQRQADSDRLARQQVQQYGAMMHAGHWIRRDHLLEGRLSFETAPLEEEWVIQTQIALIKSPNRLNAIRPTQLAMRHAMNWGFDDANNRYWGIVPPSDSVELDEGPD